MGPQTHCSPMALVALGLWSLPGTPGASAAPRLWDLTRAPVGSCSPGIPGQFLKFWHHTQHQGYCRPGALGAPPAAPRCLTLHHFWARILLFPGIPASVCVPKTPMSPRYLPPSCSHPGTILPSQPPAPDAALTLPGCSSWASLGQETLNPSFAFPPSSVAHSPGDSP